MPAGYSGTPLVKKLGLKPGMRAAFVGAPAHYGELLGELPEDVQLLARPGARMDFVHVFCTRASDLARKLKGLRGKLAQDGMIWISWPKGGSSIATDLSGGAVRKAGLEAGLVDVKVCAVDEDWSGHKFVIPVALRKA